MMATKRRGERLTLKPITPEQNEEVKRLRDAAEALPAGTPERTAATKVYEDYRYQVLKEANRCVCCGIAPGYSKRRPYCRTCWS